MDPEGIPKGYPRNPRGAPMRPGQPTGSQVGAKIKPRASQNQSEGNRNKQEDKLYINKLPINRLRGKLVPFVFYDLDKSVNERKKTKP